MARYAYVETNRTIISVIVQLLGQFLFQIHVTVAYSILALQTAAI